MTTPRYEYAYERVWTVPLTGDSLISVYMAAVAKWAAEGFRLVQTKEIEGQWLLVFEKPVGKQKEEDPGEESSTPNVRLDLSQFGLFFTSPSRGGICYQIDVENAVDNFRNRMNDRDQAILRGILQWITPAFCNEEVSS